MSDTATLTPAPVGQKCQLEEVFDLSFLELVRLVPRNPHVRALILKFTGKMPGPECGTFEQVKEWVESTCKPRPFIQRNPKATQGGIAINVDFSQTEYGRADYSVRCSGSAEFQVEAGELIEMVENAVEAGEGMEEVVERIAQKIEEDAWTQCEPSLDDTGDYDYSDHDMTGSDDSETSYSRNDIQQAVLALVRERRADLAAELQ